MNPLLLVDSYKIHHFNMYPEGTTMIYSNFTARKSRIKGINSIVFFGLQHFILKYLIKLFYSDFFLRDWEEVDQELKRHMNINTDHINKLWTLQYLPIEIKAVEEGTLVPIGVPCFTIKNSKGFGWLTNYLETLISCMMWQPITSATLANEYRKLLNKYTLETTGNTDFTQWQGHDFSMRGISSVESAILSGMAHLTSFTGTDTIPAIYQLEESYDATGLVGDSVPATEHSVMCMGTKDDEIGSFKRLLNLYPTGVLSVVSDTWNLWKVCIEYLPALKEQILARDGKLVIRPDSGDPCDIICGLNTHKNMDPDALKYGYNLLDKGKWGFDKIISESEFKGVVELLWDVFGGTVNKLGYKELDSHIGAIYGDSITLERAEQICERLKAKGFASTNVVFGIGSYTYQYNTRDTFGFAMKATYGEVKELLSIDPMMEPQYVNKGREIFKDPITDDGTKKSAKGLLRVVHSADFGTGKAGLNLEDQCTWEQENTGFLTTVFKDGKLVRRTNLEEIRKRIKNG